MKIWLPTGTPTSKIDLGTIISRFWMYLRWYGVSPLDVYFASRPSNQVGESKSTRLLRFTLSGKDVWSFRSECDMEKSIWRLPANQRFQRIIWNRWRTNWIRLVKFPRTWIIGDSSKDPRRSERSKNKARTIWRKNPRVFGFRECKRPCKKVSARTRVIARSWRRTQVVWNAHL